MCVITDAIRDRVRNRLQYRVPRITGDVWGYSIPNAVHSTVTTRRPLCLSASPLLTIYVRYTEAHIFERH